MNDVAEVEAPKTKKKVEGISREASIEILTSDNPKREGSSAYDRFAGYLTDPAPATVAEALDNGLTMGDINYDTIHGFIAVEGATIIEYTPTPRTPKDEDEVEAADDGSDGF